MSRPTSDFPTPGPHLAADPEVLADSAARLRGLIPASSPQVGAVPELLGDVGGAAPGPDSGVARFLSALTAAAQAQQARVAALGHYAGGAAGELERFAAEVGDADASSSARFGRGLRDMRDMEVLP